MCLQNGTLFESFCLYKTVIGLLPLPRWRCPYFSHTTFHSSSLPKLIPLWGQRGGASSHHPLWLQRWGKGWWIWTSQFSSVWEEFFTLGSILAKAEYTELLLLLLRWTFGFTLGQISLWVMFSPVNFTKFTCSKALTPGAMAKAMKEHQMGIPKWHSKYCKATVSCIVTEKKCLTL